MEDTSYVSLSLEKYNELYDKAKKYDEMIETKNYILKDNIRLIITNKEKVLETSNDGDLRQELHNDIKALNELLECEFI